MDGTLTANRHYTVTIYDGGEIRVKLYLFFDACINGLPSALFIYRVYRVYTVIIEVVIDLDVRIIVKFIWKAKYIN